MTKWFYYCFIHDNFLKAAECDWFLGLRTHIVWAVLFKNVLHENVLLNKEAYFFHLLLKIIAYVSFFTF
jgi:hypothetical protein